MSDWGSGFQKKLFRNAINVVNHVMTTPIAPTTIVICYLFNALNVL
jgi:hypothetical protein